MNPQPTTGVRVEADEAHNALLISANAKDYELIREVLAGIDVPPLQVLIEVTVAEVDLNDNLNYGVEYFINSGKTSSLLTTAASAAIAALDAVVNSELVLPELIKYSTP